MRSTSAPGLPFLHNYGSSGAGLGGGAAAGTTIGNGVVVVGVVGKHEEDLSQLLDRVLDHRVFGGITAPAADIGRNSSSSSPAAAAFNPGSSNGFEVLGGMAAAASTATGKQPKWMKNRLRHYHDEERGIVYVLFSWGSLPMHLFKDDKVSSVGLATLLEQHENLGLRGLLLMFSVCHVVLMVQDGAKFDPKLLRIFRVLQAAKAAMVPFLRMPIKGAPARSFYAGNSPGRAGRQAPTLSLMSGLPHALFPGQCTPVLLFICLDDFSEFEGPDSPVKISKVAIPARPQSSKLEQSTRRKFQSSLEAQVRFLIKKSRESGHHGMGTGISRGSGSTVSGGGPALFTIDPSRVVLFVDRSSNRCCDALETTISALENILKGEPSGESGLWGPGTGIVEDIQAVKEFIWRQAEVIRGRGGNTTMSVGVGMVAAAAAAAALSASAGSMGGTLRPLSNPPELPTVGSWLAAANMIAGCLMKTDLKVLDEAEILNSSKLEGFSRRTSLGDSSGRSLGEMDLACLDSGMDINMKFSITWCKKAVPAARAVYLKGLTPCYPTAVHNHHLDRALSAFRGMVRGPAVQMFIEKLRAECENLWKSGRQQCDAVSLTGRRCMHKVHKVAADSVSSENGGDGFEKPHCSGALFLSACACGSSRKLREDPFDIGTANLSFSQFPDCDETLQSVVLPHSSNSQGSSWSLLRLGNAKQYQPSAGLEQSGFCSDQNYLFHYDIPVIYKSAVSESDGSRVTKPSTDHHHINAGKLTRKLFQEAKTKTPPEKQKPAEVKLNYNEESAFPPLPQKNDPKLKQTSKKASRTPEVKNTTRAEATTKETVVENGPRSPFKTELRNSRDAAEIGLYVGFEHECPHGHRFLLSLEHLQKLGPPYSQQAGLEKKPHKRVRSKRTPNYDRSLPAAQGKSSSEKMQDGSSISSLLEFQTSVENLTFGAPVGDGRILSESDLPVFMECPHCKTGSSSSTKEGDVNHAGTVSRLQRIFLVTPPFPLLMGSRPVVQFDTSTTPNAKSFSFDCEVVLPPDSLLSLRLPFVYCTEAADGSLLPLLYNEDHPEHTAWLVKGTAFYVISGK